MQENEKREEKEKGPSSKDMYFKALELCQQGLTPCQAYRKVGLTSSVYYYWRNKLEGEPLKSRKKEDKTEKSIPQQSYPNFQKLVLPPAPRQSGFELRGSPSEIAAFVRELSRQFKGVGDE